jgi:hypothetical protein
MLGDLFVGAILLGAILPTVMVLVFAMKTR